MKRIVSTTREEKITLPQQKLQFPLEWAISTSVNSIPFGCSVVTLLCNWDMDMQKQSEFDCYLFVRRKGKERKEKGKEKARKTPTKERNVRIPQRKKGGKRTCNSYLQSFLTV